MFRKLQKFEIEYPQMIQGGGTDPCGGTAETCCGGTDSSGQAGSGGGNGPG